MATLLGAAAGAGAMLLLGLPAHFALRRRGRVTLAPYLLAFIAIGLVSWCALILLSSIFGPGDLRLAVAMMADTIVSRPIVPLIAAALCAVVGASFWWIVRPDRRHTPPPA